MFLFRPLTSGCIGRKPGASHGAVGPVRACEISTCSASLTRRFTAEKYVANYAAILGDRMDMISSLLLQVFCSVCMLLNESPANVFDVGPS